MSRHIVTINHNSLQDTMKFEGCGEYFPVYAKNEL